MHCLALCLAYRGEYAQFHDSADSILALAPSRADLLASLGLHIAYSGQWSRGLGLLDRARSINPLHPSGYWFPYALDAYRRGDYEAALRHARRLNMPDFFWDHLFVAMICGQLGRRDQAGEALRRMLALAPNLRADPLAVLGAVIPDAELVSHCVQGLRKAGLGVARRLGRTADARPSPRLTR
jgi:tetratricopeptide (TPR) repeat protein